MIRLHALAAAVLVTACASGSSVWERVPAAGLTPEERRSYLLVGPEAPRQPDRHGCILSMLPDRPPPPVDMIVDSAALHDAVSEAARGIAAEGYVVYHLAWDSLDAPGELEPIASTLPEQRVQELTELLRPTRRPRPEGASPDGTVRFTRARLRIERAPEPRFEVGWTTTCPPLLRNGPAIQRALEEASGSLPSGTFFRLGEPGDLPPVNRRVLLHIFVDRRGEPAQILVERSSGHAQVDSTVVSIAQGMRFLPGLYNGVPRQVWLAMPVTYQIRR